MRTKIVGTHTLGTLASASAIIAGTRIDSNRLNGCAIRKGKMGISCRGKTTDEGPLIVGMSVGLTAAQIGEWFTADPQSRNDETELEESQRKVLTVAHIHKEVTTLGSGGDAVGMFVEFDWPGWDVIEGEALNTFVLNADGAVLTTGTVIDLYTELYGEWLRD